VGGWIQLGGLLLAFAAMAGVHGYYRRSFGTATPHRGRQLRYVAASVGAFAVFVAADQLGRAILGRPPREPVSTTVVAWALGMLVFYVAVGGLRRHHVLIWGAVLVAGLLPVWGLGADRDAIAFFPLAVATFVSGLVDHVLLVRTFRPNLEETHAGA
jgi:hypothetical protein